MNAFLGRVGVFLFFVGLVLLAIFFTTYEVQGPQVGFFFAGLLILGLGIYLIRREHKPAPSSGRFRLLKKMNEPKEKDAEKK